ncbi:MAG: OadG family protein [Anaerolineaceae bacterium]|nr:OadG family protein [Anaerolineaceae bacterium]
MAQGWLITAIGMGLVFVLIILLWFIMALLVKLTEKFKGEGEEEEVAEESPAQEAVAAPGDANARLAAAIASAVVVAMTRKPKKLTAPAIGLNNQQFQATASNWLNAGRVRQIDARKGR